jgi:hypothetical protein
VSSGRSVFAGMNELKSSREDIPIQAV